MATLSAADLARLHDQGAPSSSAAQAQAQAPMEDPFPALKDDDVEPRHAPSSTRRNAEAAAPLDVSSEAAFPSLAAAAAPATPAKWGAKSKPTFASASGRSTPAAGHANGHAAPAAAPAWSSPTPVIQRASHSETLTVAIPEDALPRLGAVMQRVMQRTKAHVEASTTRKTGSTTFVIKGANEADVKKAKKELQVQLARNVTLSLNVPASLRAYIIGSKGRNLKQIIDQTGVRIHIPPRDPAEEAKPAAAAPSDDLLEDEAQIAITIEGDEIHAKEAQSLIQAIVNERTSKITTRLTHIGHEYYPFIAGPKGANAARLEQEEGQGVVSVRVPPRAAFLSHPAPGGEEEGEEDKQRREKDLAIVVSGDRDAVGKVVEAIDALHDELKRTLRTLTISCPKRQHRFLVGDGANDVLAATGCSIELAPIDDPSDSVTLRGPQSSLPTGLQAVMEKANKMQVETVDLTSAHRSAYGTYDPLSYGKNLLRWLVRNGKLPRVQGVQVYPPRPAAIETLGQIVIEIVGADHAEVSKVRGDIMALVKSVPPTFVSTVEIESLLHRFLIGRKGQNLKKFESTGVDIVFPSEGEDRDDVLLVLASPAVTSQLPNDRKARDAKVQEILNGVRQELLELAKDVADIRTETLTVHAKHHRHIIGPNGTTLNALIGEERLVSIKVGRPKAGSPAPPKGAKPVGEDEVVIRGPSIEVERVAKEIRRIADEAEQDAIVNGHVAELSIDASHVPHLVGKGGATVTKLRNELGVRVDFSEPAEDVRGGKPAGTGASAASKKKASAAKTKVTLTGRKEAVQEAQRRIQTQVERLADETTATVNIPAHLHASMIGSGGKYVTRLQETYSVRINFPKDRSANGDASSAGAGGGSAQKADEVVIKGGKKGVAGAKAELMELLEYEKEHNNVVEVPVSTKSVARIMGKGGANINQIREETEAQIDVDRDGDKAGVTTIKLRGTKKAIAAAKDKIVAIAKEVDGEASFVITIDPAHHRTLIGAGGSAIRDLVVKAGGPSDARASSQLVLFPRRGDKEMDRVVVRGPRELATKIKDELEAAAKALSERVVYGIVVAPSQQRALVGRGGSRFQELQAKHEVRLFLPTWRDYESAGEPTNADELANVDPKSVVKILGALENAKKAAADVAESHPSASDTLSMPVSLHHKVGTPLLFRTLRIEHQVNVDHPKVPKPEKKKATTANGSGANEVSATAARIDADEEERGDEDDMSWELEEEDEPSAAAEGDQTVIEWTLTGRDREGVEGARKRIESAMKRAEGASCTGKLIVERSAIPRIIGRGGAGLSSVQAESGAEVEVPRNSTGLILVRGSRQAVLAAKELLVKQAKSVRRS